MKKLAKPQDHWRYVTSTLTTGHRTVSVVIYCCIRYKEKTAITPQLCSSLRVFQTPISQRHQCGDRIDAQTVQIPEPAEQHCAGYSLRRLLCGLF